MTPTSTPGRSRRAVEGVCVDPSTQDCIVTPTSTTGSARRAVACVCVDQNAQDCIVIGKILCPSLPHLGV